MEDQHRDVIEHIKGRLRAKQADKSLHDQKVLSDRDVLGKGLDIFWTAFRKAIGELCEQVGRETGIALVCRFNGDELNVSRPNSPYAFNAQLGKAPPYEVVISGRNSFRHNATVRIILDETQLDTIVTMEETFTSASQVAGKAITELVLA